MDKTLDERCAEFYALDASRTQGEWALLPDLFPRDKTHAGVYVQKDERVFDEIGNLIRDAEFIAAASKIPALIRDLQARVKELEARAQAAGFGCEDEGCPHFTHAGSAP